MVSSCRAKSTQRKWAKMCPFPDLLGGFANKSPQLKPLICCSNTSKVTQDVQTFFFFFFLRICVLLQLYVAASNRISFLWSRSLSHGFLFPFTISSCSFFNRYTSAAGNQLGMEQKNPMCPVLTLKVMHPAANRCTLTGRKTLQRGIMQAGTARRHSELKGADKSLSLCPANFFTSSCSMMGKPPATIRRSHPFFWAHQPLPGSAWRSEPSSQEKPGVALPGDAPLNAGLCATWVAKNSSELSQKPESAHVLRQSPINHAHISGLGSPIGFYWKVCDTCGIKRILTRSRI